jgi:hypothetical protein
MFEKSTCLKNTRALFHIIKNYGEKKILHAKILKTKSNHVNLCHSKNTV